MKSKSAIVIRRGGGVPFIIFFRWCPGAAAAATPPTSPKRRGSGVKQDIGQLYGGGGGWGRWRCWWYRTLEIRLYLHPVFHASNFQHSSVVKKKLISFAGLIETHRRCVKSRGV